MVQLTVQNVRLVLFEADDETHGDHVEVCVRFRESISGCSDKEHLKSQVLD